MKTKNEPLGDDELNLATLTQEYHDADSAREYLERQRWPKGVACPHCDALGAYKVSGKAESRKRARKGLYSCAKCLKQFTVTVGTIFEDSKLPLNKWLMAFFILGASKKAVSAMQMSRMLGIGYKASWFMCHRIRHAMKPEGAQEPLRGQVEADEGFVGGVQPINPATGKRIKKQAVVALVERGGEMRVKVVDRLSPKTIGDFLRDNIARGATLNTDGNPNYQTMFLPQIKHDFVNKKAGEAQRERADGSKVHVNSCESFFSLLKRGVTGSFHHISKEHLPRYCDEFAFRWNTRKLTDGERFVVALGMTEGKRLTYRHAVSASQS